MGALGLLPKRGSVGEERSTEGSGSLIGSVPKTHLAVLAVLIAVSIVRCLFWVLTTQVPYGDEPAHFAFIQWLATGRGIPITGKDHVTAATIQLAKSSPVQPWRALPFPPNPNHNWYMLGQQYEGYTGPLYHLLMVPVYWAGRSIGGILGALYAIRLVTVALIAVAVPATYLLAREIFHRRPATWLLAPAVIVSMQMVNASAIVEPDAVTPLAGAFAVLLTLRARHDLRMRRAVLTGLVIGAALLAKPNAVSVLPAIALAIGWYFATMRPPLRLAANWGLGAALGAMLILGPWLVFNLHAYGALSGAKQQAALLVPVIGRRPPGWLGVQSLLRSVDLSLFVAPQADLTTTHSLYRLWEYVGWCSLAAGLIGAGLARRREEIAAVVWLAISIPLGLLTMVVADLYEAGAGSSLQGRHLDPIVPLFCVLVAYGAVAVLGSRVGASLVLTALATTSFLEIRYDQLMVRQVYTAGQRGTSAAVLYQTYADGRALVSRVSLATPCAPTAVMLEAGATPSSVLFDGHNASAQTQDLEWTSFELAGIPAGPLDITFTPATPLGVGTGVHKTAISAVGDTTPALQVYCRVADPAERQFQANYRPDHPFPMTLGALTAWPVVESVGEASLVAMAVPGLLLSGSWQRRRHKSF